jgi:large subunit ribosomal protein L13
VIADPSVAALLSPAATTQQTKGRAKGGRDKDEEQQNGQNFFKQYVDFSVWLCEKYTYSKYFFPMKPLRTFSLKAGDIQPKWYVVDAQDLVVGRLSAAVARIMRGKNDPRLTLHMNHGVHMVIVNAEKVHFTANKDKPLYRHTGYPGDIRHSLPSEVLAGKHPTRVLEKSIERMMGKAGPLRRDRMKNLYIYKGPEHPHQGQNPSHLDIGSWNPKNKRRAKWA